MERTEYNTNTGLVLGGITQAQETVYMTLGGTAGTITDTTTYPVTTQATLTEVVTVDGGDAQTVTFTTAINQGRIVSSNSFPLSTQDTLNITVTINGGSPQTITFSGALTTAAHLVAAINAQLSGGTATAISTTNVVIVSDTVGATSTIAATAGTSGMTWSAATVTNTAAGIASQMAAQLEGVRVSVVTGQVVLTTDSEGATSSVAIGTGTGALVWGNAATAGTGQSATVKAGTLLGRNSSTKKLTVYSSTGALATDEPVAVMPYELTWAAAGDKTVGVIKAGPLAKNRLWEHDNASALDTLVLDKLHKNSGCVAVDATDVSVYAN
jgi:hypothetical protein